MTIRIGILGLLALVALILALMNLINSGLKGELNWCVVILSVLVAVQVGVLALSRN